MSRVAILSGACIRHDAISNIVRLQEHLLVEAGHEVRVYGQHTDYRGGRHVVHRDVEALQRDDWYRSADLVIVHFGIGYRLFDSLGLPHDGLRVLQFHNVTPPELLPEAPRAAVESGLVQLADHIGAIDRVWSDSTHNTESLLQLVDVDPGIVRLMPLCAPWAADPDRTPKTRLVLSVGRLTAAKGQLDLVDAVAALDPVDRAGLRVEVIGSRRSSDRAYIAELADRIAAHDLHRTVRVRIDLSDPSLRSRYRAAAVFVSTSRHEGFCVPLVEALASGCRVVATDVGAVPETVGGFGALVAPGDVDALAAALSEALRAPSLSRAELAARADYLWTFSPEAFRVRLLDELADLLP